MDTPTLLSVASATARHASWRQSLVATNIANADTPGYRPVDAPALKLDDSFAMRATRAEHLNRSDSATATSGFTAEILPDGNGVTIDGEMAKSAQAELQHDLAITLWDRGLGLLRSALGERR